MDGFGGRFVSILREEIPYVAKVPSTRYRYIVGRAPEFPWLSHSDVDVSIGVDVFPGLFCRVTGSRLRAVLSHENVAYPWRLHDDQGIPRHVWISRSGQAINMRGHKADMANDVVEMPEWAYALRVRDDRGHSCIVRADGGYDGMNRVGMRRFSVEALNRLQMLL